MRYVVNPRVGLRSWERIPFACYVKGDVLPRTLSAEMFGVLLQCDGTHDLPDVTASDATNPTDAPASDVAPVSTRDPNPQAASAATCVSGPQAALTAAAAPTTRDPAPQVTPRQFDSGVESLLRRALREGLIQPAAPGQTWDAWSAPRSYPNRLFHSMIWAITGRCNLNCRHCFMARDNAPMMGEFSWKDCLALLDECERCGVQSFTLTGGEPLLHPRFLDLVAEMTRRNMSLTELNTNGVLLTPEVLQELRALGQNPEVKVSFDGAGHHDWLRGVAGCEGQALGAMRLAKDMGFRVRSQTNVHRGNLASMRDTVRLLDGMGVDRVRIIRTTESPRWLENSPEATLGIIEYFDAMLNLTRELLHDGLGIGLDMWQFARWNPRAHVYSFPPAQCDYGAYRDTIPVCKDARGSISVCYTGEVLPCNQMSGTFDNWGVSLGNVRTTPLHELLREGAWHDAVTMPVSEVRDHAGNADCPSCECWRTCMGGCRAIALIATRDYRGLDPTKCAFFKGGYIAKMDALFQATGTPWRCLNHLGDLNRTGDPAGLHRALELLGPYA